MVTEYAPRLGHLERWRRRRGQRPAVTVIIPTYNWATVLPYSIASVRAQTMTDWELMVIGDGCTDESERVVCSIDDARISWFNLARNGRSQVGPNNLGLALASGHHVAYLGHDDLWLPHHLERLLDARASFAHGHQLRIDPGSPPYVSPVPEWHYVPGDWVPPTSMMHERRAAVRAGGWRFPVPGQFEDPESDLWRRLAERLGAPQLVDDVTSVKMPAALRTGVYRDRPCDEQAFWWARIRAAPDPATFVAEAVGDEELRPPSRYRYEDAFPALGGPSADALERHRRRRVVKGLEP